MITPVGLGKVAEYIGGLLDYAVIHSGSQQVQAPLYNKSVTGDMVEVWVQVPDEVTQVDRFQLIDTNGDVFLERSKVLTRTPGRALVEVFKIQVKGVVG